MNNFNIKTNTLFVHQMTSKHEHKISKALRHYPPVCTNQHHKHVHSTKKKANKAHLFVPLICFVSHLRQSTSSTRDAKRQAEHTSWFEFREKAGKSMRPTNTEQIRKKQHLTFKSIFFFLKHKFSKRAIGHQTDLTN
jgi:hypothetical protein